MAHRTIRGRRQDEMIQGVASRQAQEGQVQKCEHASPLGLRGKRRRLRKPDSQKLASPIASHGDWVYAPYGVVYPATSQTAPGLPRAVV